MWRWNDSSSLLQALSRSELELTCILAILERKKVATRWNSNGKWSNPLRYGVNRVALCS